MRRHRERQLGVTLIYITVFMTVLIGFVSLSVDWGMMQLTKTELYQAAEAGARAAASQLPNGVTATQSAAATWGGYNTANGATVVIDQNNDVDFGTWDTSARTFTVLTGSARTSANAVRVWARRTAARTNATPLWFGPIIGRNTCDATASCIVMSGSSTLNYGSGFSGATGLTFNGSAAISGSNLRLTNGGSSQAAAVWANTPVNVSKFTAIFSFQLTSPSADGFTFTIQNNSASIIGGTGGGLGYGDDYNGGTVYIPNSICIKFDLYNNEGEGTDSTGLFTNGAAPTYVNSLDMTSSNVDLHSGRVFNVTLSYNGTTLTETVVDATKGYTYTHSYTIDIPGTIGSKTAYVGFTGGTGGLTATQDIKTFTYTATGGGIRVN